MSLHRIRRPLRSHNLPRMRAVTMGAIGALLIGLLTTVSSNAAVGNGLFEQDGNATDEGSTGADWISIQGTTPNDGTPAPFKATGALSDTGDTDEIFTGGGSKDDLDITSWQHSTGSVPDKDDITNAYAAAYSQGGDTIIDFGLDRFAQNGDANVGFWFLKADADSDEDIPGVQLPRDGTFGFEHSVGDILVLSEFSSGGDVSSIRVLEWVGTGGPINGTLRELDLGGAEPECDAVESDTQDACGIANDGPTTVDWGYKAKGKTPAGTVPTAGFFEGAINLSDLLASADPQAACFSTFLAETRSSTSVDAVLKDFVIGEFELCAAEVNISPTQDTNGIGESHTFTVTATYTVAGGTPQPITDGHVDVTLTPEAVNMPAYTLDTTATTCDVNPASTDPRTANTLDANGQCVVVVTGTSAGTLTASAALTSSFGSDGTESTEDGVNGPATKTFVDGTLRWLKHDNNSTLLAGATFAVCQTHSWDSDPDTTGGPNLVPNFESPTTEDGYCAANAVPVADDISTTDSPDVVPDADDTGGEFQLDGLALGTYRIVETAAPSGFLLDSTKHYVDLTLDDPDNTVSGHPDGVPTFVNQPLYKVIVLTCTTTGDLVDSTVTLDKDPTSGTDNETKETLTSSTDPTAAELCGLGGASYGDLLAGDYTPQVELPDVAPLHPTTP